MNDAPNVRYSEGNKFHLNTIYLVSHLLDERGSSEKSPTAITSRSTSCMIDITLPFGSDFQSFLRKLVIYNIVELSQPGSPDCRSFPSACPPLVSSKKGRLPHPFFK